MDLRYSVLILFKARDVGLLGKCFSWLKDPVLDQVRFNIIGHPEECLDFSYLNSPFAKVT